ncbi:MAG TPA: Bax inhibitor-1/YccA family protein [Roseiarcus sp.]|nr:Bax inhibitor-1/YccA family protein [Roseiarcus sp.]
MSDFDRSANARYGAGVARSGVSAVDQGLRAYMIGVYNYMTLGLGVTGLVALGAYMLSDVQVVGGHLTANALGQALYGPSILRWIIVLSPLAVVFYISARINSMSAASARNAFLVFSGLIGLSMSALLIVYTGASIGRVFFETAAAFAGLSLYGYTTSRPLSGMGSFLIMGLWGIIIAGIVNLFLHSTGLMWALSLLSIVIFSGLTAWDTQAIKENYYVGDGHEMVQKKSIYGALRLYLDFINLFQSLLMLTGSQRR